jgi:general secretion pathway protein H
VRTAISPITESAGAAGGRDAGFTLLEILIVLAIVAIIGGLALSFGVGALGKERAEVTAQEIAQGLRRARSRAIADNADRAFEIDVEARQMHVPGEAVHALPASLDVEMTTAAAERTAASAGSIRFFPDGSSTGGEITVADATQTFTVRVDWLTGGVEIVRAPPPDHPRH